MGKKTEILGKKIKILKMRLGKRKNLLETLYIPSYRLLSSMSWTAGVSLEEAKYLLVIPFHHLGVVHLAINLLSFYVKGRRLELQFGVYKLVVLVASCILSTSFIHCILNR